MQRMDDMLQILVNAPIPVNFAGLRGNTAAMQGSGWQLSVENYLRYETDSYSIRLAGKHPAMGLRILTYPFELDRSMFLRGPQEFHRMIRSMEFQVHISCEAINFQCVEAPKFQPVDFSRPQMMDVNINQLMSLDHCALFRPMNEVAEIYVEESKIWTMTEHLDAIKEMQAPKQKELRQKARKLREQSRGWQDNHDQDKEQIKLQLVAV